MILGRLFAALFERGVVFVMTSNYPPDGLWPDGLQRERFLPAIALLNQWLDVLEVDAGIDYRLRALEQASVYQTPLGPAADAALAAAFERMRSGPDEDPRLTIEGRALPARRVAGSAVWFDFATLCEGPRSQRDYLELARSFPVLFLSGVPALTPRRATAARRFTWLVDILYDHRVKLVISAAVPPEALYRAGPNQREFARTVSRLIEMQSHEYMALPHVAAAFARDAASNIFAALPKEIPVQKFKAYRTFQENNAVVSRFVEIAQDDLDPGDVVVRTKYSTINYKDALSYNGAGKIMRKYPTNAGIDMAGTVESSADSRWKTRRQGDRPRV